MSLPFTHSCVKYFLNHFLIKFILDPCAPPLFQSSSDLPLLSAIRDIATKLLYSVAPPETPQSSPLSAHSAVTLTESARTRPPTFRIGFITPPFRDARIPVTDHLHAHAYIAPANQLGWFRRIAYSSLAWYDIDDLIAEIR